MMRFFLCALLLTIGGCNKAANFATQKAIEAASGGKVQINNNGKTVTIKDKDGNQVTTTVKDGASGKASAVVKDANGNVTTYTTDGQTEKVNGAEGSAQIGGTSLPKGFPLPLIDGGKISMASKSNPDKTKGQKFSAVLQVEKKGVDAVADFYAGQLKAKGLKVTRRTESFGGNKMVQLEANKGKAVHAELTIAGAKSGPATVTLGWTQKGS